MAYHGRNCIRVIAMGKRGKSFAAMASALGVASSTMRTWAQQHDEFKRALELAREHSLAYLEEGKRPPTTAAGSACRSSWQRVAYCPYARA